jgi:hypothetical protein
MSKGGRRSNLIEDKLLNRIDRGRYEGPKGNIYDEGEKMRLHEASPGAWVRQVMQGAGNLGPMLRVIDAKAGLLENRQGMRIKLAPKAQVVVQP